MRTLVLCATVMAFALSGAACKKKGEEAGGGAAADPCNHKSKCEKEEPMAPEEITECQAAMADKDCGPKAKAMTECVQGSLHRRGLDGLGSDDDRLRGLVRRLLRVHEEQGARDAARAVAARAVPTARTTPGTRR
jgi:hypothetical protein